MALMIHPNMVTGGESYNIIVNPRESEADCVYACKHVLA